MIRRIGVVFLIIALIAAVFSVVFVLSVYYGAFGDLHSRNELLSYKNATASIVLSHEEELLGKFFSENRTNISLDQIPVHLKNALIATEDVRFYKHGGFDIRSFFRVVIKTVLLNRNTGGGSTITQQLAKNMYGRSNYGILTMPVNKTKEIILARRLEKAFSKDEILILYLNTVAFGENVYGIEAAARRFFNKEVEKLKIQESAVLIGILKANNYYNPRLYPENAVKRRNVVLRQMAKYDFLPVSDADSLIRLPLVNDYSNFEAGGPADYFLYQVKSQAQEVLQQIEAETGREWNIEEDGLIITTTLDLRLQTSANKAFKEHLEVMQKRLNKQYQSATGRKIAARIADRELKRLNMTGRARDTSFLSFTINDSTKSIPVSVRDSMIMAVKTLQAGLIAIDPVTGKVRAWVGGIDFKMQPYDQILARRQLASTFKPFLYAVAFEDGFSPCDYVDNDSITQSGVEGWSPQNFDQTFGGKYSLAGALVHSMNIPTYNLYMNIEFNKIDSLWKRMGFSFTLNNVPSLAMGTAEGSIREVAIAYAAFANGGLKISPYSLESIKTHDGEVIWKNDFKQSHNRILSENTSLLMSAILRRAVLEGTGASLGGVFGVSIPMAGKTGTSQDYADAWFAAFNPSLVMVSRVGASSPAIHFNSGSNGSGSALALPLIARTLQEVQLDRELRNELFSAFPALPVAELDCPDFEEKNLFEQIIDSFRGDKKSEDKDVKKSEPKKKSFLKRLFERKK